MRRLDPSRQSPEIAALCKNIKGTVIGQDHLVDALTDKVASARAGVSGKHGPLGNLLFLGPTGVGKTLTVESLAKAIGGSPDHMIKLNCSEYMEKSSIANLQGASIGYRGDGETPPVITQERIDDLQTEDYPLTVLLLDEVEKAHPKFWDWLLPVLDKGQASVRVPVEGADGKDKSTKSEEISLDFSRCIIVMTSNVGSELFDQEATGTGMNGIGFSAIARNSETASVAPVANDMIAAAKKEFRPEFFNRLDTVAVASNITREQAVTITDVELRKTFTALQGNDNTEGLFFRATQAAKDFLVEEGFSARYGGRHLKKEIEARVSDKVKNMLDSGEILANDRVLMRLDDSGELDFIAMEKPEATVQRQTAARQSDAPVSPLALQVQEVRRDSSAAPADVKRLPAPAKSHPNRVLASLQASIDASNVSEAVGYAVKNVYINLDGPAPKLAHDFALNVARACLKAAETLNGEAQVADALKVLERSMSESRFLGGAYADIAQVAWQAVGEDPVAQLKMHVKLLTDTGKETELQEALRKLQA